MFKKNIKSAYIILAAMAIVSCKKSTDTQPTPTPASQTQDLSLNMTSVADNNSINYTSIFTTDAGARYTITGFRYYVSNIRLVKQDGTEYPIANKYLLVNPAVASYDLGQVPVGNYKGIRFNVGVDSVTNHKDPTIYPSTNPLAIQSPGIHWDWNSGYIFLMFEGTCDTTAGNTDVLNMMGGFNHDLFFHIGMDMLYTPVDLSNSSFTINSSSAATLKIQANLNKLFTSVNIKTENESHTMGSVPLATKVAGNIPTMFSILP